MPSSTHNVHIVAHIPYLQTVTSTEIQLQNLVSTEPGTSRFSSHPLSMLYYYHV